TLSFAPHRYQRRTSERARAIEYWPGTTPPTRVGPPICEFTRYVRPRVATSGARSPRLWPSGSACARRGQSGPPAGPTPSSEPDPHTTRDWDRRRSRRWPGNYEKLASRGCPSLRMKPTLDKSYSPCSEGYSRVPTRSMELFPWWIQAEAPGIHCGDDLGQFRVGGFQQCQAFAGPLGGQGGVRQATRRSPG